MIKIIGQCVVEKYTILILDNEIPKHSFNKYEIRGILYDIVPMYDTSRCIAIKSQGEFVGAEVEFI